MASHKAASIRRAIARDHGMQKIRYLATSPTGPGGCMAEIFKFGAMGKAAG